MEIFAPKFRFVYENLLELKIKPDLNHLIGFEYDFEIELIEMHNYFYDQKFQGLIFVYTVKLFKKESRVEVNKIEMESFVRFRRDDFIYRSIDKIDLEPNRRRHGELFTQHAARKRDILFMANKSTCQMRDNRADRVQESQPLWFPNANRAN